MLASSLLQAVAAALYVFDLAPTGQAFSPNTAIIRRRRTAVPELVGELSTTTTLRIPSFLQATVAPDSASSSSSSSSDGNGNNKKRFRPNSQQRTFKDTYVLNEAINKLAEQAGDARQPVITRAAAAESLWKEFTIDADTATDAADKSSSSENDNNSNNIQADSVSFNTVLKAWGKATQVLSEHHNKYNHLLDANIPIYTAKECAQHALDLLNEREELLEKQQDQESTDGIIHSIPPLDINAYNTVMDAWAKTLSGSTSPSNKNNNIDHEAAAQAAIGQVEGLLKRVQKSTTLTADVRSYNALVDVHSHSTQPNRLDTLDRIIQHMQNTPHLQPTSRTVNALLHAYSLHMKDVSGGGGRGRQQQHYHLTFKQKEELARRAQSQFELLKQQYQESNGRVDYLPDAITYTTMMDVWSRVGTVHGAQQAEALLQELKDQQEQQQLEQQNGNTNNNNNQPQASHVGPNAYSYTVLMSAWSRCAARDDRAADRATELLEEMIDNPSITLGSRPFTAALLCYARSPNLQGKAVKALNTLKRMKELSKQRRGGESEQVKPNLQCYHAALDCCGRTADVDLRQHTVALKISFAILQSMNVDGIAPNPQTYAKLFKAVEALLPAGAERNQVAVAAWQKAKAAGVADVPVIKAFQKAADVQEVLTQMPEITDRNGYVDYSRIPPSWKKNVG